MNGVRFTALAAVAAALVRATAATVPPLPQNGLVAHLDASRADTFTLGDDGRVVEWRSLTGDGFAYGRVDGQGDTALPYRTEAARAGGIAGVTFGYAPGYEYTGTADDGDHSITTYLTANRAVSNRTVILVFQSLNNGSSHRSSPVFGKSGANINHGAIFHRGSWSARSIAASSFYGTNGYAWVNGDLAYDYANGIGANFDNQTYRLFWITLSTVANPSVLVLTSQITDEADETVNDLTPLFVSALGRAHEDAKLCAVVSEVLIYDRVLAADERVYIEEVLASRWKGAPAPVYWTGGAGDGLWSSPANWSTGSVPDETDEAVVSGATVTADGVQRVKGVRMINGASVAVAGRLEIVVPSGESKSLSGTYTGTGTLGKSGAGKLVLTPAASLAPTLTLGADAGVVDLDGGNRTFAAVAGGAVVTNGAPTTAALTVATAATADLAARLSGAIRLVKSGAGTLRAAGAQAYTGETELAAGTFAAVTNVALDAVPGLVVHLDASRADTIVEDADGYVASWRSLAGDGIVFKPVHARTANPNFAPVGNYHGSPHYRPAGLVNGLPGVQFGVTKEGASTYGALVADKSVVNRTVVIVQQNVADSDKAHTAYGNYATSYGDPLRDRRMFSAYYNNNWSFGACRWSAGTNSVFLNARTVLSAEKEIAGETQDDHFRFGNGVTAPFVVSVVVPDEYAWEYENFKPAVGCGYAYHDGENGGAAAARYKGLVCEVLVFDRALPDDERRIIETHLMNKWIRTPSVPYLPGETAFPESVSARSRLVVSGSASLSGCAPSDFAGLTVRASDGTLPTLSVAGDADVTATDLVFEGLSTDSAGTFLQATGTVSGPFPSVAPPLSGRWKIGYTASSAFLRPITGLLVTVF